MIEKMILSSDGSESETRYTDLDWLPPVPANWPIVQLGFVAETLPGYAFSAAQFSTDATDAKLLRGVNIKPGQMDWTDAVYWDTDTSPVSDSYSLAAGDVVLGLDRPFISGGVRVTQVDEDDLPALLLQRVLRIRAKAGISQQFLARLLETKAFHFYLEPLFTGVSVPHASEWQIRKFQFPLPPSEVQSEIVTQINSALTHIERLITKAQQLIELAKERRSALITAAVTGQIEVPDG